MNLSIDIFNKINDSCCKKYSDKILSLREIYMKSANGISINEFKKLNKLYREYIKNMIYYLTTQFKKYYNIDFCVTINGSLARHSNNLYSDIDINYLTAEKNYDIVIDIEDKINYILQNVLKFRGKDKVHSMVVYIPLVSNKKIDYIAKNNYPLKFVDGIMYNTCRNNAEELMYQTYNSTRNIYDVINYFNKHDTSSLINEWTYCFEFIYGDKLEKIYNNKRKICLDTSNIKVLINNLIKKIKLDNIYLDHNLLKVQNAYLKKVYKTTVLFNFYELLAIFYRMDKNINSFNLDDFYKNSNILNKKIFYYFNKYLMIIQNIQLILDMNNMDLSSHSDTIIDLCDINKKYFEITGNSNVIKDLNKYKNKLYDMCISNLERVLQ